MSEPTQVVAKASRPRRWRWLKLAVLGAVAIVGLGLIWFAVANWRASSRLNATFAELKAQGVPLSLVELERKPPPLPEDNAETYLRRAAAGLEAIEKAVSKAENTLSPEELNRFELQGQLAPEMQASLEKTFAAHAETVTLLFKAAAAPEYDPQFDYRLSQREFIETYLSETQDVRRPIRVLNYYVKMLLGEGKRGEALDACVAMLQICRHFDGRPLLVGYLVNLAVRGVAVHATDWVLRSGPVPAESHARLQAELAKHDAESGLRFALRTEHAFATQAFKELAGANVYLSTPIGKYDLTDHQQLLAGMEHRAGAPYQEVAGWLRSQRLWPMAQNMIPAMEASLAASARLRAQFNALQVLSALTQRDTDATEPISISDLGLPSEATTDPYNGKPLIVRHQPGGWLIYSVGANLQDDGGKINERHGGDFLDVGLGSAETGA